VNGLDLIESNGGTRLKLRVKPGAKKNEILGAHGGALKLAVIAAPEKGKATKAVLELLAGRLGLAVTNLRLVSGPNSRDKAVQIPLPPETVAKRLKAG